MKTFLHAIAAAALAHTALAEVKVAVGEISDKRTTGRFSAGLEINLKLSGPELADAKAIRTVITEATDDTGTAIPKLAKPFRGDGFEEPNKSTSRTTSINFPGTSSKSEEEFVGMKLEFGNPRRVAKTIQSLNGVFELLIPSKDPAAVITASIAKDAGKPLESAALKAGGAELTLRKPGGDGLGENELGYGIKDPNGKVASVEFCDTAGKKLESKGLSTSSFNGSKTVTITLREKPPLDAVAKIYVKTDKSVVTVPLALKDIALP